MRGRGHATGGGDQPGAAAPAAGAFAAEPDRVSIAGGTTDWDVWGAEWLAYQAARLSSKYVLDAARALDHWRKYLWERGVVNLADVRPADVAGYPAWRVAHTPRGGGIVASNRDLAAFKSFWSWLVLTERRDTNPTLRTRLAREHRGTEELRIIAPDRFEAVVGQLERRWARAAEALLVTGMRWGSLAALEPAHLDEARRVVRLLRPKGKVALELQITSERGWAALVACASLTGRARLSRDVSGFNAALRTAAAAAGVPNFTAHALRHTFAVRAIESGAGVRELQRWLGHANLATTERYLRHARPTPPPALL